MSQIFQYLHDVRHVASYFLHKFHALYTPASIMLHTFSFWSIDGIYKECGSCFLWRYKLCSYLTCIWVFERV